MPPEILEPCNFYVSPHKLVTRQIAQPLHYKLQVSESHSDRQAYVRRVLEVHIDVHVSASREV